MTFEEAQEPAFPQPAFLNNNGEVVVGAQYLPCTSGMTYRHWLIGQALAGMMADPTNSGTDIAKLSKGLINVVDELIPLI